MLILQMNDPIDMNIPAKHKKLILIYLNYSSFVSSDFVNLSLFSQVTRYHFKTGEGLFSLALQMMKQFIYLLFNIYRYDFLLIWFADTHAFFPVLTGKIFGKKTAIVIGGFDAVSIPDMKYGLYCANKPRQVLGKFAIRNATYLLPVDGSLIENTNFFADQSGKGLPVGIRHFVKGIRGKIRVVPTGYDPDFWKPVAGVQRHPSVVTVGSIPDMKRWHLKGCSFLVRIAAAIPELSFHIYGVSDKMRVELEPLQLPGNVYLHGLVSPEELPAVYSSHLIYAQLSLTEGLPNVLCEAMLCGCIPVGSDVNGIPGVIGNKNLIIKEMNVRQAIDTLVYARSLADRCGDHFRSRIIEKFPQVNRLNILRSLIG